MATQAGPFKVDGANRMDDAQGKRLSLSLVKPGAMVGTFMQPEQRLALDVAYENEDDIRGIVRGAWVVLPLPQVVTAPS